MTESFLNPPYIQEYQHFEQHIAKIFSKAGWKVETAKNNQPGYDLSEGMYNLIVRNDQYTIAIQVKWLKGKVSTPQILKFSDFLDSEAGKQFDYGFFITTKGFSNPVLSLIKSWDKETKMYCGIASESKIDWIKPFVNTSISRDTTKRKNKTYFGIFTCKGGVGKTTVSAHLAGAFLLQELNVALIDLDPEQNLSKLVGDGVYVPNPQGGIGHSIEVFKADEWDENAATDAQLVICDCSPAFERNPKELIAKFDYCLIPTTLNPLGINKHGKVIEDTVQSIRKYNQKSHFQVDRDRIIYSSAFRRLAQVTQVVTAQEGHVFHNRLTHSLKVAQVGKRLAESLIIKQPEIAEKLGGIEPDIVESAALAHDLGHPPFGHIAEEQLDECAIKQGLNDGFEGNAQSFRILTRLAIHRIDYYGLNLTRGILNAVLKYPWLRDCKNRDSKQYRKYSVYDLDYEAFLFVRDPGDRSQTIEASIMDFADDITYSVHDLEDFYLAGLIPLELLATDRDELNRFVEEWLRERPNNKVAKTVEANPARFQNFLDATYNLRGQYRPGSFEQKAQIKRISSQLIQNYINSVRLSLEYGDRGYLKYNQAKEEELKFLQRIVWSYVISNPRLATQRYGQKRIIKTLFEMYLESIKKKDLTFIPVRFVKEYLELDERHKQGENITQEKTRMAIDIVANLSEAEAVLKFRRLTGVSQGSFLDYWE